MYYDSSSALFWYKLIFMIELFLAEFIFTWRLKKKKLYWVRILIVGLLCCGIAVAVPILQYSALYSSLLFFGLYFLSTLLLKFVCYDESWVNVFFCTIAAYATQHIAFETYNFIIIATGLNNGLPVEAYGDRMQSTYDALVNFIHYESYLIVYWICYLVFGQRIRKGENMRLISIHLLFLSIGMILVSVVINAIVTYYSYSHPNQFYSMIVCLLIIFCCIFVLTAQFNLLAKKKAKEELSVVQKLWQSEEKQYNILKENIDYINIKCHDLKHQIRHFGDKCSLPESSVSEMMQKVSVYETAVKTGNEALDILLMEKSLTCLNKEIRLTTMADGNAISFMEETEIYSLLGNALDNAIESLESIEDKEKKVIGIIIKNVGDFASIHLYNYCPKKPKFKDGLPLTTKDNRKHDHGYGMKSMRLIAEKYGGTLTTGFENETFNLDILLPIKKK